MRVLIESFFLCLDRMHKLHPGFTLLTSQPYSYLISPWCFVVRLINTFVLVMLNVQTTTPTTTTSLVCIDINVMCLHVCVLMGLPRVTSRVFVYMYELVVL